MYELEYYRTPAGRSPYQDFRKDIEKAGDKQTPAKVDATVMLLGEKGSYELEQMDKAKKLEGDIWELRPTRVHRVFYFWTGQRYVILGGYRKQKGRVPKDILKTAMAQRRDYLIRQKARGIYG